jgi:hypothetical protein
MCFVGSSGELGASDSSLPSGHRAAHFMTVEEHLSTFKQVGFIRVREICPAVDPSLMGAERPTGLLQSGSSLQA